VHIKVSTSSDSECRAKEYELAEDLFNIRTARLNGAKGHSLDEVRDVLTRTIGNAGATKPSASHAETDDTII